MFLKGPLMNIKKDAPTNCKAGLRPLKFQSSKNISILNLTHVNQDEIILHGKISVEKSKKFWLSPQNDYFQVSSF